MILTPPLPIPTLGQSRTVTELTAPPNYPDSLPRKVWPLVSTFVAPFWIIEPEDTDFSVDDAFIIDALAEGIPNVKYQWYEVFVGVLRFEDDILTFENQVCQISST